MQSGDDGEDMLPDVADGPGLFGDALPPPPSANVGKSGDAYVVLARKYRPQRFEDLIGQEAMVRTLTNAFASDRIAHAFMLTGVRGVGKTTTARLIARALNYHSDTIDQPSITLDPLGSQCAAITRGNHPDVFELDAASRTGVGDMRELLDGVRYGPIAARYKVYIIDEVHMLSTSAFNALLKTLEEPPPHVKFVFATTEIRKVPVTILSRCQRFDLRRVDPHVLTTHLSGICANEGARVDVEGLELIARAAEGSVRDGLSLLDQAIVQDQGAGVGAAQVRDMLGLADRSRTLDLMEAVLKGDGKAALLEFAQQYQLGAEPALVLRDVMDVAHELARAANLAAAWTPTGPSDQIARMRLMAQGTTSAALSRLWQMLLRGFEETQRAPDPVQAVDMCLMRLCAAQSLPPPEDLAKLLLGQGAGDVPSSGPASAPARPGPASEASARQDPPPAHNVPPSPVAPPATATTSQAAGFASFDAFLDALDDARDIVLLTDLERFARLVAMEGSRLTLEILPGAPADLQRRTAQCLTQMTGADWIVELGTGGGETRSEQSKRVAGEERAKAEQDPLVLAALKAFPGATIVEVRPPPTFMAALTPEALPSDDLEDASDDMDTATDDTTNVLAIDFGRQRVAN
ncbi:MAG: hypothetical protein RLZZ157_245 [Pseudomonadota bacterium]